MNKYLVRLKVKEGSQHDVVDAEDVSIIAGSLVFWIEGNEILAYAPDTWLKVEKCAPPQSRPNIIKDSNIT